MMRTLLSVTDRIGLLLVVATAATVAVPASAQVAAWNGRYVWEENVGRHGGPERRDSIVAFVTCTLAIGPGNGPTGCTLDGQGYQTNKRIRCTVAPRGRSVIVRFHGYGSENMFDDGYRRGQPLFTLTRSPRGITTSLQGLRASSDATRRTGMLFRKARTGGS